MTSSQTAEELPWFGPLAYYGSKRTECFVTASRRVTSAASAFTGGGLKLVSPPLASTNSTPDILWMSRGEYNILLFYHPD